MTRIYDRDFRYLLLNLLPQHRLPPGLRRDVDQALRDGGSSDLRRQSVRALEALCEADYFERADVRADNGNVVVGYRRRGGNYQVSLALPRPEWEEIEGGHRPAAVDVPVAAPPAPAGPEAAAPSPAVPRAAEAPAPGAAELLPDIARSFAISDRSAPVLERLDVLLGTLERWLAFTFSRLDVLEDTLVMDARPVHSRVRVVSDADLRASELVRRAIESGARRLVPRAQLSAADLAVLADGDVVGVAPIFALGKVVGALRTGFGPGMERAVMDARLDTASAVVR